MIILWKWSWLDSRQKSSFFKHKRATFTKYLSKTSGGWTPSEILSLHKMMTSVNLHAKTYWNFIRQVSYSLVLSSLYVEFLFPSSVKKIKKVLNGILRISLDEFVNLGHFSKDFKCIVCLTYCSYCSKYPLNNYCTLKNDIKIHKRINELMQFSWISWDNFLV